MTEREIFFEALEMATPEARAAYLLGACGQDVTLRRKVEELLKEHFSNDSLLAEPSLEAERPTRDLLPEAAPAQMLGRYKLLEKIGEGGFGEVWMAEQREPIKRRVALKIIKLGMDSRQIVNRFAAERQALAMMDHPNIAKIFDAGTTGQGSQVENQRSEAVPLTSDLCSLTSGSGRPYFVMELVCGIKITDFCDQNQLPTQERLRLFILVCQAIQHAHQKGIIHRDIKPSNILVTLHDGVAVPKVIDFGIAKATQQELTDQTVFTQFQQFMGTPAYISPEQAEMSGLDIDTRADIYSLGVLLYELLVGQTPFDAKEMMQGGLDALRQIIREKEPLRPSTKLNTLPGEARTTAGKRRQTDFGKLVHQLQGDLDWIVMKCLEKDRSRRYETANGLAMDIQRHLANEPVTARSPSAGYRFQKMVKRNKLAFAAVAAIATVLVLGVIVSTWQAIRAEQNAREARRAEQKAEEAAATITRNLYFAEMNLAGQAAATQGGISRIAALTAKWVPEQGAVDRRGWEWYYLRSLMHLDLFTLSGHTNGVNSVAWSPDGKRVASGSRDKTIKVWDTANRQVLHTLRMDSNGVNSVSWSPDGKRLAGGSAHAIKVWDAENGQLTLSITGHTGDVNSVAWSPDGKRLASGSSDRMVKVWDAASGQAILSFTGHTRIVNSVAWSWDGTRLASGSSDTTVKLWDIDNGTNINTLPGHGFKVTSVSWSPDGTRLASASWDQTAKIWDTHSGTNIHTLRGHLGIVSSVAWSPDGKRLASGSYDNTVNVWDAATGQVSRTFRGHIFWVNAVSWTPDGKLLASASDDKRIKVWEADRDEVLTLYGHTDLVVSVVWSPDGKRLASASGDNTVKVWESTGGQEPMTLRGHIGKLMEVSWSSDGTRLASGATGDKALKIWDATSGQLIKNLNGHAGGIGTVAWSPDGQRLASGGGDETVKIWNPVNAQVIQSLRHSGWMNSVAWSPDGKRLASASGNNTVKVWNADSGQLIYTHREHTGWALTVAWSPDGERLASGSFDNTVNIWDAASGQQTRTLRGHNGGIGKVSWSPDGTRLASGSADNTVKVWDAASGQEILTLRGHTSSSWYVVWSPDGTRLASASYDKTIKIWDARKGYASERE